MHHTSFQLVFRAVYFSRNKRFETLFLYLFVFGARSRDGGDASSRRRLPALAFPLAAPTAFRVRPFRAARWRAVALPATLRAAGSLIQDGRQHDHVQEQKKAAGSESCAQSEAGTEHTMVKTLLVISTEALVCERGSLTGFMPTAPAPVSQCCKDV